MKRKKRVYCILLGVALCVGLMVIPQASFAQPGYEPYHLKCYQIKDDAIARKTIVGLTDMLGDVEVLGAFEQQFPWLNTENCEINKTRQFCVAAEKEVVEYGPGITDPIEGGFTPTSPDVEPGFDPDFLHSGQYICYFLTCKGKNEPWNKDYIPPEEIEVWDQFGKHNMTLNQTYKMCAPVIPIKRCYNYVGEPFGPGTVEPAAEAINGGPGCKGIDNPIDCEEAYKQDRYGNDVSCFWGENYWGEKGCWGCGGNNQVAEACTNYCGEQAVCEDPKLKYSFPRVDKYDEVDWGCRAQTNKRQCEKSFQISYGTGEPVSCYWDDSSEKKDHPGRSQCVGCGPNNQLAGMCENKCGPAWTPPPCDDPTITNFVWWGDGGCQGIDTKDLCDVSYHLYGDDYDPVNPFGVPVSCSWDDQEGACYGCEGDACPNTCGPDLP